MIPILPKLIRIVHGSHLYGINTADSDRDFKSVAVPGTRDILLDQAPETSWSESTKKGDRVKNNKDDVETELYTLKGFLRLVREGQTVAHEILFAPDQFVLEKSPDWIRTIDANRDKLIHRNISSYIGYAKKQAARFGAKGSRIDILESVMAFLDQYKNEYDRLRLHMDELEAFIAGEQKKVQLTTGPAPLIQLIMVDSQAKPFMHLDVCDVQVPVSCTFKQARKVFGNVLKGYGKRAHEARLNQGVDWKAMSHALRVGYQSMELLTTHKIVFPSVHWEELLAIKKGEVEFQKVADKVADILMQVKETSLKSDLPDRIDQGLLDDILYDHYLRQVRRTYEMKELLEFFHVDQT